MEVAIHNYHSSMRAFPGVGGDPTTCFSAQAAILPFAEQGNLQALINFSQPLFVGTAGKHEVESPSSGRGENDRAPCSDALATEATT